MSDLISRERLLEELNDKFTSIADINSIIIEQPTVFDVDKVVEELENSKKSIIGRYDSSVPMSEMPSRKIEYNKGIDKAIEIVKAGGMDE